MLVVGGASSGVISVQYTLAQQGHTCRVIAPVALLYAAMQTA